jgi:hypothetical protein
MDQTLHAHSKRLVGRMSSDNCYVSAKKGEKITALDFEISNFDILWRTSETFWYD